MRKSKIIKELKTKIELLHIDNTELKKRNEILQFIVDKGRFPVAFIDTGIVQVPLWNKGDKPARREMYNVEFIDTFGDIKVIQLDFLQDPEFDIKCNDAAGCIFTATEYKSNPKWYKLYKDKRLVVEIPKPYEYSTNDYNNKCNCNS